MKQTDFEHGSIPSNLIRTTLPMMVAQLLALLYSIVDRIYIGKLPGMEGQDALAGIGLCFPVIIMVTAFTNLFGTGGAPLCAMARGRHDSKKAAYIMNLSFSMLLYLSWLITAIGELFHVPLLRLFGADSQNLSYAVSYLRIYLLGTSGAMLSTGLVPYINAQGYSQAGMSVVTLGAILNIILDPLFIFALHMGVSGAALATIFSQTASALIALKFLTGRRTELRLKLYAPSSLISHGRTLLEIVTLGSASFIMQFTNALVSVCCNGMLSSYGGSVAVTVMTIISSVRQIMDTPILALSEGATPVLSYNYGAKRPARIRQTIVLITAAGLIYTILLWGLIFFHPSLFIHIFNSDPSLHAAAVPALRIYFAAFLFQAFQYAGQTVFKALGKRGRAIFFSLFRKVVLVVPLTLLLPGTFGLGTDGVFLAEPVSNLVGGSACFITMLLTILPELKQMEDDTRGRFSVRK